MSKRRGSTRIGIGWFSTQVDGRALGWIIFTGVMLCIGGQCFVAVFMR